MEPTARAWIASWHIPIRDGIAVAEAMAVADKPLHLLPLHLLVPHPVVRHLVVLQAVVTVLGDEPQTPELHLPVLQHAAQGLYPSLASLAGIASSFAPDYAPEEILAIATKLYRKAKNL